MSNVDIRRAETRPHTKIDWLDSRHSFSFGRHYDPTNTHHGLLLVSNDDRVRAGTGFSAPTPTATWRSSRGCSTASSSTTTPKATTAMLYPGLAQRMSAGTGIAHSEMNPSPRPRTCTSCRCGCRPTPSGSLPATSSATSTASSTKGGLRADRVGPGPRRRDLDPPTRRRALGRAAPAGRDGDRARRARTCTCSSRVGDGRPRGRRASSPRVTPPASPAPARRTLTAGPTAPRSWSGSPRRCARESRCERIPRTRRRGRWSAPASPACTRSTGCGRWA